MKQVLQNLKTGEIEVAEVPAPVVKPGHLLIQTRCSLISSGTERMLVTFAKSGLLGKARQQPEKLKQVIDKIKTDGLLPTVHSVFARLDEPLPLGYCNCGTVIGVGTDIEGFNVGERVISNGPHAEIVCMPKNLCEKVPDDVDDEQAAFTVLASIGLQGIRLIKPTFGETIVVFGLGLIGLISVQLLRNCGCNVVGIDLDKSKLELARQFGARIIDVPGGADLVDMAMAYSNGKGVDGVVITAAAKGDSIINQSAQMSRQRGRIILVGVVNTSFSRAEFYEKELSFQVSCSYGPGRYDSSYEEGGQDYPYGLVRWTEQRNFKAILDSLSAGKLDVTNLISERIAQAEADKAYKMLMDDPGKRGLLLTYPKKEPVLEKTVMMQTKSVKSASVAEVVIGLVGAGIFAKLTLLPALKKTGAKLKTVADINGVAARHAAKKFGFEQATNDYKQVLSDEEINTVVITTPHNLHARMVIEAMQAAKHVHVEKPLCLTREELSQVRRAYEKAGDRQLLVGFNRRFSPHMQKVRSIVSSRSTPMCMTWLINAGFVPADVWIQDKSVGGGRIIGEGCHWLDLMQFLVGQPIVSVSAAMIGDVPGVEVCGDKMSVTVCFADGSIGTLHYFANGHKSYQKETFTLFCDKKVLHLDNFRKLRGYGWNNFKKMNLWSQDKGHKAEMCHFVNCIANGETPLIPFEEIENTMLATFAAVESAQGAGVINI